MNRLRIGAPRAAATALLASMIALAPALGIAAPAGRPHVIATVDAIKQYVDQARETSSA